VAAALGILVALRQPEIYDIYYMLVLSRADQEIVRLYIAVQKSVLVHKLNPLQLN
jgi:hypothetical protein